MLRKNAIDLDYYWNYKERSWRHYKIINKYFNRIVFHRLKKRTSVFRMGMTIMKIYLVNKNIWYTHKKNCLLGSSFEKKTETFSVIYNAKTPINSKTNWF